MDSNGQQQPDSRGINTTDGKAFPTPKTTPVNRPKLGNDEPPEPQRYGALPGVQKLATEQQEPYYNMPHACKVALVCVGQAGADRRHVGLQKDRTQVLELIDELGSMGHLRLNEILLRNEATWEEAFKFMNQLSQEFGDASDYQKHSGLICFVLGRGSKSCPDSDQLESIWKPFCNPSCRSLIGKPKLFFIQSCKDSAEKKSSLTTDFGETGSNVPVSRTKLPTYSDLCVVLPVLADFGGEIGENAREPSRFVQAMSQALQQCRSENKDGGGDDDDLKHFLRSVNGKLQLLTAEEESKSQQMIQFTATLLHKLRLFGPPATEASSEKDKSSKGLNKQK